MCTYQELIFVNLLMTEQNQRSLLISNEFISFNGALALVRRKALRKMEILRNAGNSTYIFQHLELPSLDVIRSRTLHKHYPEIKLCAEDF